MRIQFRQFVAFAIPSLWIYYAFCADLFPPLALYRETFGGDRTYLDLTFESNPEGPLLAGRSVRFSGYWIDEGGEFPVQGIRVARSGAVHYQFKTPERGYYAQLQRVDTGCEPRLKVESEGKTTVLRAGFCR